MWMPTGVMTVGVLCTVLSARGELGTNQVAASTQEVLQHVRRAHADEKPHRIEYVRPANLGTSVPGEIVENVSRVPGVSKVTFAGKELVVLTRETLISDGAGRYRIEAESLQQGGVREKRTSVSIWTSNTLTRAAGIGVPMCEHDEYPEFELEEQVRLMAAGRTPHRRLLAPLGYLPFARYAIEVLSQARDTEALLHPEGTLLVSESVGVAIVATPSGEMVSGKLWDPVTGRTRAMRFVGRHTESLMPARHPKECHEWMEPGNALKAHGFPSMSEAGLVIYTSARFLHDVGDDLFSWHSVAAAAKDHTGKVTRADGTEVSSQKPPRRPVNRTPTPLGQAAPPGGGLVVLLSVTGIALLAVGAVVWLKGRTHERG